MGMTLKEYDIILYRDLIFKMNGFKMKLDYEEEIFRNMAYSSYIAPHLNPKKMAKNIDKFWPMNTGNGEKTPNKKVSDEKRKAIQEALKNMNNAS